MKVERSRNCGFLWYVGVVSTGFLLLDLAALEGSNWTRLNIWGASVFGGSDISGSSDSNPALHISGTSLRGSAVIQFRDHVDCFSKSGRWEYDPTPRHMVPNVFGSDPLQVCEMQFLNGTPGAVVGDRANEIAANGSAKDWIVREELKWEWRSSPACPLLDIDRAELCRRIGSKRNVLVVGDSINQELYWILLNHLVVNRTGWVLPRNSAERHVQGEREVCEDVLGGAGQGFRIGHIRNDRLSTILHRSEDRQTGFFEFPWINYLDQWNISILLLNRGAHFEPDPIFTESLLNLFSLLTARWPSMLVLYRNTPPGHINCTEYHQPMPEREPYDRLKKFRYNWAGFAKQNALAQNMTQTFGYIFLDLDSIMAVRADGHRSETDCLHYCLPGPLDIFAKLFFNTFLLLP